MPATTTFPLLARPALEKHAALVTSAFPEKAKKLPEKLQSEIAQVFAATALANTSPSLVASVKNGHGYTHAVKARGVVFIIDEHFEGNKQCLKLFAPMKPADFKLKKLEAGGVAEVYGEKKWSDVDRIVVDIHPSRVDVFLNGDRENSLEGDWSRALAESALAVLNRAKAAGVRAADEVDATGASPAASASGASAARLVEALTSKTPKIAAGPTLGTDLEGAVSWRGMPVVVTSDRSGESAVHVMIERRGADGSGTWWPIPVPDHLKFPTRGCSVMLDGDQLIVAGGFDGEGKLSAARFSVDLAAAMKPGFTAAQWKERSELSDATAWAAAAINEQKDALVVGGVAGFYLAKNKRGDDVKVARQLLSTQVGGTPQWRDRTAPPTLAAGASTLVDSGCVFVGPGATCDGKLAVFDHKEGAWFALPDLPIKAGGGQLFKRGDELIYAGGFLDDDKASRAIYSINLKDPMAAWVARGAGDAVAGKARVVERDGKLVSLLVAPKGALLVHLE